MTAVLEANRQQICLQLPEQALRLIGNRQDHYEMQLKSDANHLRPCIDGL
jgi:hypothetical protein